MPQKCCLGLLLYGYATGIFSSRKNERATYEAARFRFIAGNLHPDHDTLAAFRQTFLPELKDLFVQVLLLAQEAGVLKLGTISLDGTNADASKRKAVSYKRLPEKSEPAENAISTLEIVILVVAAESSCFNTSGKGAICHLFDFQGLPSAPNSSCTSTGARRVRGLPGDHRMCLPGPSERFHAMRYSYELCSVSAD